MAAKEPEVSARTQRNPFGFKEPSGFQGTILGFSRGTGMKVPQAESSDPFLLYRFQVSAEILESRENRRLHLENYTGKKKRRSCEEGELNREVRGPEVCLTCQTRRADEARASGAEEPERGRL